MRMISDKIELRLSFLFPVTLSVFLNLKIWSVVMTCTAARAPADTPPSGPASPPADTPAEAPGHTPPRAAAGSCCEGRSHRLASAQSCNTHRQIGGDPWPGYWYLHCCLGTLEHCSRATSWHSLLGVSSHTSLVTLSHSLLFTCWHCVLGTCRHTLRCTGWQTDLGWELQLGLLTFLQPPGTCGEQLVGDMPALHFILALHHLHTHSVQQHLQSGRLQTFKTILQ